MALDHPVVAFNAANNIEAHQICSMLHAAGVEAFAVEDRSQVAAWIGGLLPQVHRPKVWIDKSDIERAKPILEDYMLRAGERRTQDDASAPIEVVCAECGKLSSFPANQVGSVQDCLHCGAFVDVGDEVPFDDWSEGQDEECES